MVRRSVGLLLVSLLLSVGLVACGGTGSGGAAGSTSSSSRPAY